ncbi:uncharacterized protein LOC115465795 isoform X1 [Microcaecilia unicolor]|uniref:Uncharacterized protein LOC115465795 isoform X1 n=1 Tax=Microcaecilia unicolor TaxID=1415580 RepID=A0A6P7XGS9_9AMPH|nr:uncharacterized protein LOC115465795 isoform X1 [Microcaecilia unicolor]XP_030052394.1 uncharacterized protein LOC115465795 isoform X1 [Microcaecilia unicolor]
MSQGGSVQMIHQRNSGHASQPAQSLQAVPPYMMKYMRPKEAKRKPNFTRAEVMVLAQEVELRQEVLFGSGPIFFKLAAWQEVVTAVNAVGHMNRSLEECKKRHRDLKRRCKEKMAAAERNRNAAGGGPVVQPIMTPAEQIAGQTMPSCMLQGVCSIDTAMPTVLSAGSSLVASSKLEADGLRQSWGLHETEHSLERSGSPSGASTSGGCPSAPATDGLCENEIKTEIKSESEEEGAVESVVLLSDDQTHPGESHLLPDCGGSSGHMPSDGGHGDPDLEGDQSSPTNHPNLRGRKSPLAFASAWPRRHRARGRFVVDDEPLTLPLLQQSVQAQRTLATQVSLLRQELVQQVVSRVDDMVGFVHSQAELHVQQHEELLLAHNQGYAAIARAIENVGQGLCAAIAQLHSSQRSVQDAAVGTEPGAAAELAESDDGATSTQASQSSSPPRMKRQSSFVQAHKDGGVPRETPTKRVKKK